ncbi:MAG: DUF4956 domain-containing protein [Verrucomicrobia bacterium]|nr:DUF4956 domain-containing protein [Verrucomicrobiota bacterium]
MLEWFLQGDYGAAPPNWPAVLLAILLAFACGHILSWVYMHTHSGLSYSRSFVNALVIMPMIVALVMMVLSNNLVTAFGMMAVFAIVRFRNILRDTLDTTYILMSLVIGMAAGTQKFSSAILGCAIGSGALLYLWYTSFGTRHRYDLIVNLHWARLPKELPELAAILNRHCYRAHLASQRTHEGYEGTDLSYRLLLRDPNRSDELIGELRQTTGVSRVTSMQAEEESEI